MRDPRPAAPAPEPAEITRWLHAWEQGDTAAFDRLIEALYDDLLAIASRRRSPGDTLGTTELVHEAYLLLRRQRRTHWHHRSQFYAVAARVMRRLLTDRARRRHAAKRGGAAPTLPLTGAVRRAGGGVRATELDLALRDLEARRPELARWVELRFFVGLTNREIAEALGVSTATVERRIRLARAWLCRHLGR